MVEFERITYKNGTGNVYEMILYWYTLKLSANKI